MAAFLADAGCVVLAVDHLGTGGSSRVDDEFLLTPEVVAAANHAAFTALLDQPSRRPPGPGAPAGAAPWPRSAWAIPWAACWPWSSRPDTRRSAQS